MASKSAATEVAEGAGHAAGMLPLIRRTLRSHAPFWVSVMAYVALAVPLLATLEMEVTFPLATAYRGPVLVAVLYLGAALIGSILGHVFVRRRRPFASDTWRAILGSWLPAERLAATALVLLLLPAFLAIMVAFRTAITAFQPFSWDVAFMEMDRWLHAGQQPWELLQPILGHPAVTRFLDAFYVYGWFGMLWIGVAWQTVHGREPVRMQFLVTFILSWVVLGTLAAVAASSAGPVYFGRVTGNPDPFQPLMAYLRGVDATTPLRALAIQERLWAEYTQWGGITAMPSMHLAEATVVALAAVRTDWRWILLVGPAVCVMLLGSVHLGWHYAVDGYVGIAGAVGIWWVAGKIVRRWEREVDEASGGRH